MKVFDDFTRVDGSPARHTESHFEFLNRARDAQWQRTRDQIEEYFAIFPSSGQVDLRARLRSRDDRQHTSAWWELYIFTLFRVSGYEVVIHPRSNDSGNKPDYLASSGDRRFYVEATVVFEGVILDEEGADPIRDAWIYDLTNDASNPDYLVGLSIVKHGSVRPGRRDLVPQLEQWLSSLDYADAYNRLNSSGETFTRIFEVRDWILEYEALPTSPEHRGKPGRLLGIHEGEGGNIKVDDALRKALRRKAKRYGDLDAPLILAAMMESSFAGDDDAESALIGPHAVQYVEGIPDSVKWIREPDGLWFRSTGPVVRHVPAAIVSTAIRPWAHNSRLPRIWHNPWAHARFDEFEDFPTGIIGKRGGVTLRDATIQPSAVFGLDADWPH